MNRSTKPKKYGRPRFFYFLCAAIGLIATYSVRANAAQFVYESERMGVKYKVFLYEKEYHSLGKWKFQTKAVFNDGSEPYFSDHQIADCTESTIDGNVVTAIPRSGIEFGDALILKAVCN